MLLLVVTGELLGSCVVSGCWRAELGNEKGDALGGVICGCWMLDWEENSENLNPLLVEVDETEVRVQNANRGGGGGLGKGFTALVPDCTMGAFMATEGLTL